MDLRGSCHDEEKAETYDDSKDRMPLSLLMTPPEDIHLDKVPELTDSGIEDEYVELGIYAPSSHLFDLDDEPGDDEMVLIQMGHNIVRQAVVQRDDDLLTPEQLKTHWAEVHAAMLKELQTRGQTEVFQPPPEARCPERY